MSELQIISPIEQNFSCNNCGLCCATPWKVKVAPERIPVIESTERFQELQREGYVPLPVMEGEAQTGRRDDGSCLFRNQGGCTIHREKGSFSKPIVCQMFPYSLINSPDGYYLSLSFSCPSVLKGTGEPVSQQVHQLKEAIAASSYFSNSSMDPESQVAIRYDQAIPWSRYTDLEQNLLSFLGADQPVTDILRAALLLAKHSSSLDDLDWQAARLSEETGDRLSHLFPFYACYTIATLENQDEQHKIEDFARRLMQGENLASNLLQEKTLPPFQILHPPDSATRLVIQRYIQNFVLGKQLISVAPMVARLLMLSVALAVLLYYLQARTGSSQSADDKDLAWCFHLVEVCVLGHSDVLAPLFEYFEKEILN